MIGADAIGAALQEMRERGDGDNSGVYETIERWGIDTDAITEFATRYAFADYQDDGRGGRLLAQLAPPQVIEASAFVAGFALALQLVSELRDGDDV